jgi:hypothetical protein
MPDNDEEKTIAGMMIITLQDTRLMKSLPLQHLDKKFIPKFYQIESA